jgi:autophagy-related protein 11
VKQEEERTFRATQESLEAEVERLRGEAHASSHHRDNADRLEQELEALRTQVHQESAARRSLEQERIELKNDVDKHRNDLDEALREVSHRAKQIDDLKFEVDQLKAEADELRQLQKHSDTKVTNLLDEQAKTLQHLEEARLRGDDLQEQISVARAEGDEANKALKEAGREKERLLKAQASEAERALRDHKAETDGDIAVLDHQLGELRTSLEKTKAELKDALVEVDVGKADISGLREEVQRLEHELKEASKTEDELRISVRDSNRTMSELERKSQQAQRMIVEVLEVAKSLRDANVNVCSATTLLTKPMLTYHARLCRQPTKLCNPHRKRSRPLDAHFQPIWLTL